ncbi:MAG: hypothetical protein LAO31_10980 [Acidobacteriia bacterium]|nr:hypothetical protein [Terriglobia bacterium]
MSKKLACTLFVVGAVFVARLVLAGYKVKPFSTGHAKSYLALDSHDKITIAAQPYDRPEKVLEVFDRDPSRQNFVTVLIVVSNDSDDEIEVDGIEVELANSKLHALHPTPTEDVVREIFYPKDRRRDSKGKIGIGGIGLGGNPEKDFTNARADFLSKELGDKFIPPHSTASGFVFYETPQLEAALVGGKIYIPRVRIRRSADPKQVGRELLFYEIDLKPAIVGH